MGIDWMRAAATDGERALREAYLTLETSCGPDGLVSLLLLSTVCRRRGRVAEDLQAAAEFAEVLLAMKVRAHQDEALEAVAGHVTAHGPMWS